MKPFILSALIVLGLTASAHAVEVSCLFPSADLASIPCQAGVVVDLDSEYTLVAQNADDTSKGYRHENVPSANGDIIPEDEELGADAYERRLRKNIIEQGGCNADFLPHFYAAGCFNHATKRPSHIPVGASDGGE